MNFVFPDSFLFGAATSSFQIEGHNNADGAFPCIWSSFSKKDFPADSIRPENFTCGHYSKMEEDVALMKKIGLQTFRFSVAWPRVLPKGMGEVNKKGLDFYDRLVDQLLAHDIIPMLTLYHWDLPRFLQDKGGWASPEMSDWFARYTDIVADKLADRVPRWVTLNEPWVFLHKGMVTGEHAPGYTDIRYAAKSFRNILLCHGIATDVIKSHNSSAEVGASCNLSPLEPLNDSEEDHVAASDMHSYLNRLFLDPWLKGTVPDIVDKAFEGHFKSFDAAEMKIVHTPMDFLGINYYTRHIVTQDKTAFLGAGIENPPPNAELTEMNWEIYPEGLYKTLKWAYKNYETAMYVTENGSAFSDKRTGNKVKDPERTAYLRDHLQQCLRITDEGIPLLGYYAWSLMDNYEWNHGYDKRFGLVYVDFDTKERIIKDSGLFYQRVIENHRKRLTAVPKQIRIKNRSDINIFL